MISRTYLIGAISVAVLAASGGTASAKTMTFSTAKRAITNHAYELMQDSGGSDFDVTGCFRRDRLRIACRVTIYDIQVDGGSVDCTFHSHAYYPNERSTKVRLGDTKPRCTSA